MSPRLLRAAPLAAVAMLLVAAQGAAGAPQVASPAGKPGSRPAVADGPVQAQPGASWLRGTEGDDGSARDALSRPPNAKNVELVSRLLLGTDEFGPVAPGQVADVAVHKNTAYVISWSQPFDFVANRCFRGGFWSVDISDPANPVQLTFVKALDKNYHGEGAHVITFPDGRDVLAVNNETCIAGRRRPRPSAAGSTSWTSRTRATRSRSCAPPATTATSGTSCAAPGRARRRRRPLAHATTPSSCGATARRSTSSASTTTSRRARTPTSSTSPTRRAPVAVAEFDLDDEFGFEHGRATATSSRQDGNPLDTNLARHGGQGRQRRPDDDRLLLGRRLRAAGHERSRPRRSTSATATSRAVDPLTGNEPPRGNAHQAEFSHDNKYILAADEILEPVPRDHRDRPGRAERVRVPRLGRSDRRPDLLAGRRVHRPDRLRRQRLRGDRHPAGDTTRRRSPSSSAAPAGSRSRSRTPTPAATTAS